MLSYMLNMVPTMKIIIMYLLFTFFLVHVT
jgi:hypothetical protein